MKQNFTAPKVCEVSSLLTLFALRQSSYLPSIWSIFTEAWECELCVIENGLNYLNHIFPDKNITDILDYRFKSILFIWRHGMEMLSALLALCLGNPPVSGGFSSQMVSHTDRWCFLDVNLDKLLNKHSSYW